MNAASDEALGARVVTWAHRFMLTFATGMFVFGIYLGLDAYTRVSSSAVVEGKVIALEGAGVKYAVVRFSGPQGNEHEFKSTVGSDPPKYFVGENVGVLLDPNDPDSIEGVSIDNFSEISGVALSLVWRAICACLPSGIVTS